MDAGVGELGADDAALAALRDALDALSATPPRLVFQKTLTRADVDRNQSRLHIPFPRSYRPSRGREEDANALAAFLTADERDSVRERDYPGPRPQGQGMMQVPAYDRHGRRFDMMLRMVRSHISYRLFGSGWIRFLADNQLAEAMAAANETGRKLEVELWAFRSKELLPLEPQRGVETGHHHPDGALGMAILIRN